MMKTKNVVVTMLVLGLMLLLAGPVAAEPFSTVTVETPNAAFEGIEYQGRTLLPVRSISEAMGARVDWDEEQQVVRVAKGMRNVSLQVGSKEAVINGKVEKLDVPPLVNEGRTYAPARVIAEALGAKVDWDGVKVTISIPGETSLPPAVPAASVSTPVGNIAPDSPVEFKAVYALFPYNTSCESTRLYYSNDGMPKVGKYDIYLGISSFGEQSIVLKNYKDETFSAAKEMLKVYCPNQWAEAYQDMKTVEKTGKEVSGKYYDGRSFECFIAQHLQVTFGAKKQ